MTSNWIEQALQNTYSSPYFSLVVASVGPSNEIADLLLSLVNQTFKDFEVIVVDQNIDDRLVPIIALFADTLPKVIHLKRTTRGTSQARNFGCQVAQGDILLFPDDDCTYLADTLMKALVVFRARPTCDFLCGPAMTPQGVPSSGRWATETGLITTANVWTRMIEFNFFVRRTTYEAAGGFDESLGGGVRNGACEGPDLAIRMLQAGASGWFDQGLYALHPEKVSSEIGGARAVSYGRGMGRVLRKSRANLPTIVKFSLRPLGGMLLGAATLNRFTVAYYWRTFIGRVAGFVDTPDRRN